MTQAESNVHPACFARPYLSRVYMGARLLVVTSLIVILAACAARPPRLPEPLRAPNPELATEQLAGGAAAAAQARARIEDQTPAPATQVEQAPLEIRVPEKMPNRRPVSLVLDGVPISTFINVVFGSELGFNVSIDRAVRERADLVSLRLAEPQMSDKLYRIAAEVLRTYGVTVSEAGVGVLQFSQVGGSAGSSSFIVARSLPGMPAGQRPVFVAVPLDAVQPGAIAGQLRTMFGASNAVTFVEMPDANALMLSGPPEAVREALDAVTAMDRAGLRDKRSIRVNPIYVSAEVLAQELRDVLTAEGYSIRTGPGSGGVITFVPVASANALIIFSESDSALEAARDWVEKLDQPSGDSAGDGGVFIYEARHTTVENLVPVLEALVAGSSTTTGGGTVQAAPAASINTFDGAASQPARPQSGGKAGTTVITSEQGKLAVDPVRNIIVYKGNAVNWRAIEGVLKRLDKPARQVVIEVTVAEVTLSDEFSHGIEWALRNITVDGAKGPVTALAGSTPNAAGLIWRALSSSGQVRAVVNLFARDSRVTILSTPRLMVKSGETAAIDVGTEVPIITSQATRSDAPVFNGNSSILQQIQYRKTGVLLQIEPVVHSSQRVDLKISQEVSEATQTDTSDISSPSIFSRRLNTSLTLADGESILLGGLISSSRTDGKTKVPLLGDLPLIGNAFQNRRRSGVRTELLMVITPYIVEDAVQARAITEALQDRFESGGKRRKDTLPRGPRTETLTESVPMPEPAAPPAPEAAPQATTPPRP